MYTIWFVDDYDDVFAVVLRFVFFSLFVCRGKTRRMENTWVLLSEVFFFKIFFVYNKITVKQMILWYFGVLDGFFLFYGYNTFYW